MKTLIFSVVFLAITVVARADTPPQKDSVVLTLTTTPSLSLGKESASTYVDPWSKPYRENATSQNRVNGLEERTSARILDIPGPGYRKVIEWYENMRRPLPRLDQ